MHQARIAVFYFFLGVTLQLPELAVRFFLINKGIGVAHLGAFQATLIIPWCLKPLYGFISDSVTLCGQRRKPYIVLSNLFCGAIWMSMCACGADVSIAHAQVALFVASMLTCFADVMYDSLLVEYAKLEEHDNHGKAQSWCWAARALGALLAAAVGGYALIYVPPSSVFMVEGVLLCAVSLLACMVVRERSQPSPRLCTQVQKLTRAMRTPSLWKPALFVFLFAATPSSYTAFFYFLVNELKFSSSFLGLLTCVRHGAMLLGTFIYSRYLRNVNYRKFFVVLVSVSAVLGATPIILVTHVNARIGLPNSLFAAGDDLFLSVISQVALMPCLVLAAKLCPAGIEASMYASFVSILNFAGIISEYSGALCTHLMHVTKDDFANLPWLIALCTASSLMPLCFIYLLPKGNVRDLVARPGVQLAAAAVVTPVVACAAV